MLTFRAKRRPGLVGAGVVMALAVGIAPVAALPSSLDGATPGQRVGDHGCPRTMPDPSRAACLLDNYKDGKYKDSNFVANWPDKQRQLIHEAWIRAHARAELSAQIRRDGWDDFWANIHNGTDCVAMAGKGDCFTQAQVEHEDNWKPVAKWALVCGSDALVASRVGGTPAGVLVISASLCTFHALLDIW
jgi:hypothetical protein